MKKHKQTISIPDGVIPNHVMQDIQKALEQYQGKTVDITIEQRVKRRTNPQNAYYHGVVVKHVQNGFMELGELLTTEQVHEFLKRKFLSFTICIDETSGTYEKFNKTTKGLDTKDFNTFIEQIQIWSAEWLGIIIPDPKTDETQQQ